MSEKGNSRFLGVASFGKEGAAGSNVAPRIYPQLP
jgi:hypothetical protein